MDTNYGKLSGAKLVGAIDALDARRDALTSEMIAAGLGNGPMQQLFAEFQHIPAVAEDSALCDLRGDAVREIERRYGPDSLQLVRCRVSARRIARVTGGRVK